MATINGIVTIGDTEIPGQADVLLLNAAGTEVVASTTSDPVSGAYSFDGLPSGATFRVLVLGGGVYRSRAFGPVTPFDPAQQDPHWANVVSLLHFDEVQEGPTFLDEKGSPWTIYGGARTDSSVKKFGEASFGKLTKGSYAQLSTPQPGAFTINGVFTAEIFARLDAGHRHTLFSTTPANANEGFYCAVMPDGVVRSVFGTSTNFLTVDTTVKAPFDEWCHIAVTKNGANIHVFINGTKVNSWSVTHVFPTSSQTMIIGAEAGLTLDRMAVGWLDEFRFTRDVARYTENFDPPTAPFPNF